MLNKLLKKDFQSTARFFIPLIIGFILISTLCKILVEFGISSSSSNTFISIMNLIFFALYFIYIIAFYILTYVFVISDFYKTMVGEHGYLTHTLPVKINDLINSKLLIAIFWQIITTVFIILSFFLFAAGHISSDVIKSFTSEILPELTSIFGNTNFVSYIIYMIIAMILNAVSTPLMFFACIAIGHLFRKHRIIGAIISYFGLYMAVQIISTIILVNFGYSFNNQLNVLVSSATNSSGFFISSYMWYVILFSLILCISYYLITYFIFKKKLNLE